MLRRESGASEMTLYGENNTVLATSTDSAAASLPKPLTEEVVLQMQQDRPFRQPRIHGHRSCRNTYSRRVHLRGGRKQQVRVLQAHFPVDERLGR